MCFLFNVVDKLFDFISIFFDISLALSWFFHKLKDLFFINNSLQLVNQNDKVPLHLIASQSVKFVSWFSMKPSRRIITQIGNHLEPRRRCAEVRIHKLKDTLPVKRWKIREHLSAPCRFGHPIYSQENCATYAKLIKAR